MPEAFPENQDNKYFLDQSRKGHYRPQNEFEHGDGLVDSEIEESENESDTVKALKFSSLISKHIQTANIGLDTLVRIYQNDAILLTYFLDFGKRNEGCESPFLNKYIAWRNEVLMTKTIKGNERILQAIIGTRFQPNQQGLGAFGNQMDQMRKDSEGGFLSGLFKKKNQQQG